MHMREVGLDRTREKIYFLFWDGEVSFGQQCLGFGGSGNNEEQ